MSYTPVKIKVPNSLDSLGLELSLVRFNHETLEAFRNRILAEVRDPSGPTEQQYFKTLNRKLSLLELPVLEIDLVYVDGEPTAVDPYLEVTSTMLRFYSDYENQVLDCEMAIHTRETWLTDVVTLLSGSSHLDVTQLEDYQAYLPAGRLAYSNTIAWTDAEVLPQRRVAKLFHGLIRDFYPEAIELFTNDVGTPDNISVVGDYCIDKVNGVLFTLSDMRSLVSYSYSQFPFVLRWQPVRAYPLQDPDCKYAHTTAQLGDTGPVYVRNNALGAEIANHVLSVHPLTWGK